MRAVGYYRSASCSNGRALILELAERRGICPIDVLADERGEYGSLRAVQSAAKFKTIDAVIAPSPEHLGRDRYMRLETELFFKRNGVKLIFAIPEKKDLRHEIAVAVNRYFSYLPIDDAAYGTMLPYKAPKSRFRRIPPFGYDIVDGRVVLNSEESETVRAIFESYIKGSRICDIVRQTGESLSKRGMRFTNMTVKTVLTNERYLGRLSGKGYHLTPIITYDIWLKAHERFEREHPPVPDNRPLCSCIKSRGHIGFFRSSGYYSEELIRSSDCVFIDSDALECRLGSILSSLYTEENAVRFYNEYFVLQKELAEEAIPKAASEYNRTVRDFEVSLAELISGDDSETMQMKLDRLNDRRNVFGMRLRRINSERALFSIDLDKIVEFFERVSDIGRLCEEEKRFILDSLVPLIRYDDGELTAYVISPVDRRPLKYSLEGVIR